MRLLFLIAALISTISFAQADDLLALPKKLKKEIGIKGIKELGSVPNAPEMVIFKTKKNQGLYDLRQKRIIADTLNDCSFDTIGEGILFYSTKRRNHLLRMSDRRLLFAGTDSIQWIASNDTNFTLMNAGSAFGLFDHNRNDLYLLDSASLPNQKIQFFEQTYTDSYEPYTHSCLLLPKERALVYYGFGGDGIQNASNIYRMDNYLIEERSGYLHGTSVYELSTGKEIAVLPAAIHPWKKGFYAGNEFRSYYDKNFQIVFEGMTPKEHYPEHFRTLIDSSVLMSQQLEEQLHLILFTNGTYRVFDLYLMDWVSQAYNGWHEIGLDTQMGGTAYFTRKGRTMGLFHSRQGEVVPPNYTVVETRILNSGNYAYRADNEIFQMAAVGEYFPKYLLASRATAKRTELALSTPINHASIRGEEIVLSLRKTQADVHDSYYYTESNYIDASGIYNYITDTWTVANDYHVFFPLEENYLVSKADGPTPIYTVTQLLDKELNPISKEYGAHFLYNGKLYVKNEQFETVELDPSTGKEIRNLGKIGSDKEDFRIWSNHLLIGSTNYRDDEFNDPIGFDIEAIINALGDPVIVKDWEFHEVVYDGMIMMVKYKMDGDEKARDSKDQFIPEAYRVYDLNRKKFLSPPYNSYTIWDQKLTVWMDTNERERAKNPKEVQKHIDIPFGQLRTFYTTM